MPKGTPISIHFYKAFYVVLASHILFNFLLVSCQGKFFNSWATVIYLCRNYNLRTFIFNTSFILLSMCFFSLLFLAYINFRNLFELWVVNIVVLLALGISIGFGNRIDLDFWMSGRVVHKNFISTNLFYFVVFLRVFFSPS